MARSLTVIAAWAILGSATGWAQGVRDQNTGPVDTTRTIPVPDGRGGVSQATVPSGSTIGTGEIRGDDDPDSPKIAASRCATYLQAAQKAIAENKWVAACQSLMSARGLTVTPELSKQWNALAAQVNAAGTAAVSAADEAVARKDYAAAVKGYRQVMTGFSGLPVAKQAADKLKAAESDPEVRAALKEAQATGLFRGVEAIFQAEYRKQGQRLPAAPANASAAAPTSRPADDPAKPAGADHPAITLEMVKGLDDAKLLRVVDILENIATTCRESPTATRCADWLAALTADEVMKARLAPLRLARQATQDLAAAKLFLDADMLSKAAELYRQVAQRYPKTAYADQASRQLTAIEAKLGK